MTDKGYFGQDSAQTNTSETNTRQFAAQQLMNLISTATLCKVDSITNKGEVKAIGTMSCTPLVNMLDGVGRSFKHGSINKIIYCRMQGGKNAVILDPKVGDIGLVVFCDRDISAVKQAKKQANPGSGRRNDFADGVWVMTVIADAPENYLEFKDSGTIVGKTKKGATLCLSNSQNAAQIKFQGLHVTCTDQDILVGKAPVVAIDPNPNND